MTKLRAKHTHLKLTLVENGIDFVRSGIERYFLRDAPSPRDHKYAVLHVFAGVLLLLKARLSREHPALIFSKVEGVGNPEALTVGLESAIDRLKMLLDAQSAELSAWMAKFVIHPPGGRYSTRGIP